MHSSVDPQWYHATTLVERLAARGPFEKSLQDDDRATFRLQTWKSQRPFSQLPLFEQRLALDRLSEAVLRNLLAEPMEEVRQRMPTPPQWLTGLMAALSSTSSNRPGHFRDYLRAAAQSRPAVRFLAIAEPIVDEAATRLERAAADLARRTHTHLFDAAALPRLLLPMLSDDLLRMVTQTMVLEMHIARLEEKLEGDTPEARFESFIECLRTPRFAETLLSTYPVLARCMLEAANRWVDASMELLERLALDEPVLAATFAGGELGSLASVSGGLSDPRHGGRAVAILQFSSGRRIVYKPKSLAVDAHFQALVGWLNARGARPSLRALAVLDRGDYGWTEYARVAPCGSVAEVRRFYERQGSYLALLYALEATDFHAGNIIASAEHPFLVDLEALLHPHRSRASHAAEPADARADRIAREIVSQSVLRIGLLPERRFEGSDSEAVDLSGLGTLDGQLTAHGVAHWESAGSDGMRLVRKRKLIRPDDNRPSLAGNSVNVLDYRHAILEGFTTTYSLLLKHRDELLSDDGPLAQFAADQVCVFLRSARTYRRLVKESYHPDLLQDALDRDRHFDLLWVEVEHAPELADVIAAERAELLQGDVPVMLTRPGSRDLWTADGRIENFFDEPSLTAATRRVRSMCEEDLKRQSWLIEASLATLHQEGPDYTPAPASAPAVAPLGRSGDDGLHQRLLSAAAAMGDRLEGSAVRGGPGMSWIGLHLIRDRFWSIADLGVDLGGGLPGVALFLAYLGAVTRDIRYSSLAEAAVVTTRHQIDEERTGIVRLGAFDGWGGIIYTLIHLGVLWHRPEFIAEAVAAAARVPTLVERDDDFDVANGAAGCIVALRRLNRIAAGEDLAAIATRCGDHLLANRVPVGAGWGWRSGIGGARPLAGFAHGAAGIAWALLELAAWTGEPRFHAAAAGALRCERTLFVEDAGNWLHLIERRVPGREESEETSRLTTSWCHGAPGIALARLCSLQTNDDPEIASEIATAIATTLLDGFGGNHSLGHGDVGNLEVLLQASRILRDQELHEQLVRQTGAVVTSIETFGPRSAAPFNVDTPGLLTGLAGTGFGLLRLAEPAWVPSILTLDGPPEEAFHVR